MAPYDAASNIRQALGTVTGAGAGEEEDLPWSARMAMELLEERAAGGERAPWIASLPAFVATPPLEFDAAELAAGPEALLIT